jgi:small neutral amino acid transporter SnatA (MarC family)
VLIGPLAVVGDGFLGSALAANWGVSTPILTICAGLIVFLVGLHDLDLSIKGTKKSTTGSNGIEDLRVSASG